MSRGNDDIAAEGAKFAAKTRKDSEAKIGAAKARIRERIQRTGKHGEGRLTIAAVLREAGLNRLYLEGKDRKAAKQDVKDWIALAGRGFRVPQEPPPSERLEDRFTALKVDFLKLQNAYVAAHMTHGDRAVDLAEAKKRIRELEAQNAELLRTIQAAG